MKNNKYTVLEVEGFEKDLLRLAQKYPTSIELVEKLFQSLEQGNFVGTPIPRLKKLKGNRVYKTRLENPDANKGKRSGFRVIWFLATSVNEIYPLTIYSKNDQTDVSPRMLEKLINKYIDL